MAYISLVGSTSLPTSNQLANLKEECEAKNHELNVASILSNYDRFQNLFEETKNFQSLISKSYEMFKEAAYKSTSEPIHANRVCGFMAVLLDFVWDASSLAQVEADKTGDVADFIEIARADLVESLSVCKHQSKEEPIGSEFIHSSYVNILEILKQKQALNFIISSSFRHNKSELEHSEGKDEPEDREKLQEHSLRVCGLSIILNDLMSSS